MQSIKKKCDNEKVIYRTIIPQMVKHPLNVVAFDYFLFKYGLKKIAETKVT